jgi:hypothetical protein
VTAVDVLWLGRPCNTLVVSAVLCWTHTEGLVGCIARDGWQWRLGVWYVACLRHHTGGARAHTHQAVHADHRPPAGTEEEAGA